MRVVIAPPALQLIIQLNIVTQYTITRAAANIVGLKNSQDGAQ